MAGHATNPSSRLIDKYMQLGIEMRCLRTLLKTGVARNVLLKQHTRTQLTIAIGERKTELRSFAMTSTDDRLEGAVHGALSELSQSDREIVELIVWEELTPIEIAAVLGISANAARVRLHRARQRLADIFLQSELRTRDIDLFP
jgi:RNA polymerase sigma-70 factor (ECF subfamily)